MERLAEYKMIKQKIQKVKSTRFKPSMRVKRRYLVLDSSVFAVRTALLNIDKTFWKIIDISKGKVLLRINLKQINEIKTLFLAKGIHCIGISGTIKRAKQKFWNKGKGLKIV